MALHTRPNGSTTFTDDPTVDPTTGAKIDEDLNALTSIINALDNANFSGSPQMAGNKVDLTTSGFLPTTGGNMTGAVNSIFDGVFRTMRASGNGRIREYRGSDGAIWGISYNTYWTGSAWAGRDITDVCAVLKMESDGLHYYHAVSGASASAPSWTEIFHASLTGIVTAGSVDWRTYAAGDVLIKSSDVSTTFTNASIAVAHVFTITRPGTLRIKFDLQTSAPSTYSAYGRIYRNDVAVGTLRNKLDSGFTTYSEDIAGWVSGDEVRLYVYVDGGATGTYQNFRLYSA